VSAEPHPQTGQPVGPPVDDRPAARPGPVTLQGRYGRLEKLAPRHAPSLWDAVKEHGRIWTYMPSYGPFPDLAAFSAWIAETALRDDPYFYAVIDTEDRVLGMLALMAIRPGDRVCEIGGVLYAPALQRTPLSTEAQYLMARYAFETLGYRRYEWKCDALNAPSRRAAQRLGLTFEGIFRQHRIARARNRDSAWFSMLDSEWPARKANFERWLAPENFDAEGRQRTSLGAMNGRPE
jgi:RimJ/RimL family protein N-acetyltransferase